MWKNFRVKQGRSVGGKHVVKTASLRGAFTQYAVFVSVSRWTKIMSKSEKYLIRATDFSPAYNLIPHRNPNKNGFY